MRWILIVLLCGLAVIEGKCVQAQESTLWQIQESGTTAGLRGIDSVDGRVAWAGGTDGTVLRTTDDGAHWTKCAVPDAAKDGATLDFRGVQAFDAETAIAMASGPGAKSRLYKTTDGCKTWRLLFANPDGPQGFFDGFWMNGKRGIVLGDPVGGKFAVFLSDNSGKTWKRDPHKGLALEGRTLAAFAASNTSVARGNELFARAFATGGAGGSFFFSRPFTAEEERTGLINRLMWKGPPWKASPIPVGTGTETSGTFSVAYRYPVTTGICAGCNFNENSIFIAVGGDYKNPNDAAKTAAWSGDGGWTWTAATTPPHGYRSAVEWSDALKAWIAVGTNGSDISRDDGKTWQPLDDRSWNALSLPFVVGPNGRIGRLDARGFGPIGPSLAVGCKHPLRRMRSRTTVAKAEIALQTPSGAKQAAEKLRTAKGRNSQDGKSSTNSREWFLEHSGAICFLALFEKSSFSAACKASFILRLFRHE